MQVDDAPTDDYTDIGGLDKQIQVCITCFDLFSNHEQCNMRIIFIQELIEAVVLPMTHAERFTSIGTIIWDCSNEYDGIDVNDDDEYDDDEYDDDML
jgi:hypothetical protein